ncbi:MAG: IS1182 family transposase [Planctomycetes bacterium]|nr:IS1182 family transposase [Planctomycetota bacterium]
MARFKRGLDIDQGLLLPPSLRDWLPEDHLAWFIKDAVDELDIDKLVDAYRVCGKGELPYHPRMMLRVLIYAYATGTFSSRKIESQLRDSVAFRVLAENQVPGHRSIRRFRANHLEQFSDLFAQVVKMAAEAGLARIGTLAIDGSKLKANASKHKAMSYARMKEEEEQLEREIAAIMRLAQEKDEGEDVEFGPDFRGDELPEELRRREERLARIRAAKARLEKRKAEEAQAADEAKKAQAESEGREPPRERPGARKMPKGEPKPKDQENFTDPDSRIMKTSTGFEQCYNVQIAVDGDSRLIVANVVNNCASDAGQLIPVIEAAMENTGLPANQVLADAGYRKEEDLAVLEAAGIDAYIALGREGKDAREPGEQNEATQRMREKLGTEEGRERYRQRKHVAEPPFGWLKSILGFRGFSLRGLSKVAAELNLVALALNLRRMKGMTSA